MITIKKLSLADAQEVLSELDKAFGLIYSNDFCVHGNTVTAEIKKDEVLSKDFVEDRFFVEVKSGYFTDSSLRDAIGDWNDPFFLN